MRTDRTSALDGRTGLAARKAALRTDAIAAREAIAPCLRASIAAAIATLPLPFLAGAGQTVSAYHPVGAELNILPVVARIAALGHPTCLPVVVAPARPLAFRAWRPGEPLVAGVRQIPVPPASAPDVVPDILLVPFLLFDRAGYRLGYGGGYYDRTIADLRARRAIIAVGVGFAAQEIVDVPHDFHDARLDWIVTERGAFSTAEIAPDDGAPRAAGVVE